MYYEGQFRTQYDGGNLEDENCTPTSVAMAINQVTDGQISLTGSQIRSPGRQGGRDRPRHQGLVAAGRRPGAEAAPGEAPGRSRSGSTSRGP